MSKVPEGVTDAVQIDGVTIMGEFWHVTMPTVWPMLSVFLITGLVGLFTGGGPIFTLNGMLEFSLKVGINKIVQA